jgi:hypothetical protein
MLVAVDGEPLARTGVWLGVPTPGLGSTDDYHYTADFLWESVIGETLDPNLIKDLADGVFVWLGK